MKRALGPTWTSDEIAAGKRFGEAWLEFFARKGAAAQVSPPGLDPTSARLSTIRAKYEARLLRYPNVVGVTDGVRMRGKRPTEVPAIIVLVSRKISRKSLAKSSRLPTHIEGVPVDVVEVGQIEALGERLPTRSKAPGTTPPRRKSARRK
jgi:hypothetical protein